MLVNKKLDWMLKVAVIKKDSLTTSCLIVDEIDSPTDKYLIFDSWIKDIPNADFCNFPVL